MAPRALRSFWWKHFVKDGAYAACKYCNKKLKTCQNTSNLKQHIERKHVHVLSSASRSEENEPVPAHDTQMDLLSDVEIDGRVGEQPGIQKCLSNVSSYTTSGSRRNELDSHIVQFICSDCFPLSIVEGEGFRKLMKKAVPLYKVPCRQTITKMIDQKYLTAKCGMKSILCSVENYSLSTDLWSDLQKRSYLGVTCHYIEDYNMKSLSLACEPFEVSHTAENLSKFLFQVLLRSLVFTLYIGIRYGNSKLSIFYYIYIFLFYIAFYFKLIFLQVCEDWGLSLEKAVSVSCDNCSNIVKAVELTFGAKKMIRCIAHTLNLAVESPLQEDDLKSLLDKVRKITKYFHQSTIAADELRRLQRFAGIPDDKFKTLIGDVSTRWNSEFYMLERFLEISDSIAAALVRCHNAPDMVLSNELDVLKDVCVLQPFERVTREMSSESFVSGSKVIPIICCLEDHLKKYTPKHALTNNLKDNLLKQIKKRFCHLQKVHLFSVSTIMDPRFKKIHLSDGIALGNSISFLRKCLDEQPDWEPITKPDVDMERKRGRNYPEIDIWRSHKELMSQKVSEETSELLLYLQAPLIDIKCNPLHEWKKLTHIYPKLSHLASKYALVLASSAPAERLFSKAGHTASKRRSRLSPKRLSKLLFLNSLKGDMWEKFC